MNRTRFEQRTGIAPETFTLMEAVVIERKGAKKKSERPTALTAAKQGLLTLAFWREDRTFTHLGDDWKIHESSCSAGWNASKPL